jgi:hypothetical protein
LLLFTSLATVAAMIAPITPLANVDLQLFGCLDVVGHANLSLERIHARSTRFGVHLRLVACAFRVTTNAPPATNMT